jgi:hypothetical protein
MILGYFLYVEGTVCNQITKDNTNNTNNTNNLSKIVDLSTTSNTSNLLLSIHPISFIISSLVIIYSLCLIYGLYSLN